MSDHSMILQLPSDRMILEELTDGRNLAANIAADIDRHRKYVNRRLAHLHDYSLVKKIGPVEGTGLYEITPRGAAALELIDQRDSEDFDDVVDARAADLEVRGQEIVDHAE